MSIILISFLLFFDVVKPIQTTLPAVVKIETPKGNGKTIAAGFVIYVKGTSAYIVTAAHAQILTNTKITFDSGSSVNVIGAQSWPDKEITIIQVKNEFYPTISVRNSPIKLGEAIYVIGHPRGYEYSVAKGVVSSLRRKINIPSVGQIDNLLQIDAGINSGNSGGPVIDTNGNVIGMVTAVDDIAKNIAFVVKIENIMTALKEIIHD